MPRPSMRAEPGARQDAVDRSERREERPGLLRGDLGDLTGRTPQHQVGERGEPPVLVRAQADGEDPAGAVSRAGGVDPVGGHARQQRRVVRAGLAQEGPQIGVGLGTGGGREDAGAGVGGPPRMRSVDDGHPRAEARQLVGEGEPDQAGTEHGDVAVLPVHGPESTSPAAGVPAMGHHERRAGGANTRGALRRAAGVPLRPALRHAARRAAHALRRRGAGRRRDRAAAARPADVVLPVPHGRGPARHLRAACRRARPRGVRALGQAVGPHGPLGTRARRMDGPIRRRASSAPPHPRRPGLGRPDRARPARRPARAGPPGRRHQHRAAHRRRRAWRAGWPGPATPTRTGPSPSSRPCSTTSA